MWACLLALPWGLDSRRSFSEDRSLLGLFALMFGLPCSPLSRLFSSRRRWISSACSCTLACRVSTRFIRYLTTWRRPSSSMVLGSKSSNILTVYTFPPFSPSGYISSWEFWSQRAPHISSFPTLCQRAVLPFPFLDRCSRLRLPPSIEMILSIDVRFPQRPIHSPKYYLYHQDSDWKQGSIRLPWSLQVV